MHNTQARTPRSQSIGAATPHDAKAEGIVPPNVFKDLDRMATELRHERQLRQDAMAKSRQLLRERHHLRTYMRLVESRLRSATDASAAVQEALALLQEGGIGCEADDYSGLGGGRAEALRRGRSPSRAPSRPPSAEEVEEVGAAPGVAERGSADCGAAWCAGALSTQDSEPAGDTTTAAEAPDVEPSSDNAAAAQADAAACTEAADATTGTANADELGQVAGPLCGGTSVQPVVWGQQASMLLPAPNGARTEQAEWGPDTKDCSICRSKFTLFLRRHHCRSCGACVCSSCSPYRMHIEAPLVLPLLQSGLFGKLPDALPQQQSRLAAASDSDGLAPGATMSFCQKKTSVRVCLLCHGPCASQWSASLKLAEGAF